MKPTDNLVTVATVLDGTRLFKDVLLWQKAAILTFVSDSHKPCEKETLQPYDPYVCTRQSDIARECTARRRGKKLPACETRSGYESR